MYWPQDLSCSPARRWWRASRARAGSWNPSRWGSYNAVLVQVVSGNADGGVVVAVFVVVAGVAGVVVVAFVAVVCSDAA